MPIHSNSKSGTDSSTANSSEVAKADPGFVPSLLHSAAYEGLQAPVQGLAQIVDQTAGTKLQKSVTFMDAPERAEFQSASWYGQQFGSVGKLVPFIAAYAVTHKAFTGAGLTKGTENAAKTLFSKSNGTHIAEIAVAGFATEAIFVPVVGADHKRGQPLSNFEFIEARAKNGAVGAITFATLSSGMIGLRHAGMAVENKAVKSVLTNNAFGAAISGIPTGIVSADTHARIVEGRSATNQERVESAYSMFIIGGALGGLSRNRSAKTETTGIEAKSTPTKSTLLSSISERVQKKVSAGYESFDSFMASINPLLKGPELQPAHIQPGGRSGLGNRAMESTLHELGKPVVLENRSATVSSATIEGSNPSSSAVIRNAPEAVKEAKAKDKASENTKLESTDGLTSASKWLDQLGMSDIAEFVKNDRVLKKQKVVKTLGQGNDSPAVLELAPSKEFPNGGALKVTIAEGGFESNYGKRPGDAKIYGKVHEVDLNGSGFSGSAALYVQELADPVSRPAPQLVDALSRRLDKAGLEITDVGSGIEGQVGVSRVTGDLVVIDYPAVTKKGGGNETLEAIRGGYERVEQQYEAENSAMRRGKSLEEAEPLPEVKVDVETMAKRQEVLEGTKLTPAEKDILKQLSQAEEGFFSMKEVYEMAAYVDGKYNAKGTGADLAYGKKVVEAVVKKARTMGALQKPARAAKIEKDLEHDDY